MSSLHLYYGNPQAGHKSSYKFMKRMSYVFVSTILHARFTLKECEFKVYDIFDVKFPVLQIPFPNYEERLFNLFKGFEEMKIHRLEQIIIELRSKQTMETLEVYMLKINYGEDTEEKDMDGHFQDPTPIHLQNDVKCLYTAIREVVSELPLEDQLDFEIFCVESGEDIPQFNFGTKPSTMSLGVIKTWYHSLSIHLAYLDFNSKFITFFKEAQNLNKNPSPENNKQ